MNALNEELRKTLTTTFLDLEKDASIDVIILTGGGRAFCAGLDLKELSGEVPSSEGISAIDSPSSRAMMAALDGCTRPKIGAINGVAITGGFEIAVACDFLIGSTNARFADTHARLGIIPGWGLSQKLSRWIGPARANEMHYTSNFVGAEQAERWGLLNRVVAPEELLPTCMQLARDMQGCDQPTLRELKRVVSTGFHDTFNAGLAMELEASSTWRQQQLSEDAIDARRQAVQERGRAQA
jgi:enoyl-CoA hydratase